MQQRARNRSAFAVVFFSLVTLSMSSCKKTSPYKSPTTPAPTAAPTDSDTTALTPHLKGKPAPDFTLTTLQGKQIRLSSLRGKPIVLNFWATWCGPCKMEMPWFQEFASKYADRGLVVLGVANDEASPEVLRNIVGRLNITYPILLKNPGVVEAYGGLDALPETFYIDPQGVVTIETAGASPGASGKIEIQHNIDTLLATR
jgi:thiol-disulfide isomerase/thioredoxin